MDDEMGGAFQHPPRPSGFALNGAQGKDGFLGVSVGNLPNHR
jgi:hypothetical protein